MKKILIVLLFFLSSSCVIQFKMPYNSYLTIYEIKKEYKLTYKECHAIIKAAENNELDCKYDPQQECWTYDNTIDYSLFKFAK